MSSHDACEVLLSPEDLVMLQEVALEGEGPEETLSRVLSECRREWMKKGRAAGMVENTLSQETGLLKWLTDKALFCAYNWLEICERSPYPPKNHHPAVQCVKDFEQFAVNVLGMDSSEFRKADK